MSVTTMYQDVHGNAIHDDDLVWGMDAAAGFCGVSRITVWRWVQRGYFIDGAEVWNDFRSGELRTTTVFYRPALIAVANKMAQHCAQTGAGWRPERWGQRKRARIDARTGVHPRSVFRHERIITGDAEADLYGFAHPPGPVVAQDAPDPLEGLLTPEAYEALYGKPYEPSTPSTAHPAPSRRRSTPYEPTGTGLTPLRIDRRTVNGTDVKRCWPGERERFKSWKAEHAGKNPSIRQWSTVLDLAPDVVLTMIDHAREAFRNYVPELPEQLRDRQTPK